jgi:membrane protein
MFKPTELRARADAAIWDVDTAVLPRWRRGVMLAMRIVYAVVRDLLEGQLSLRAMSLVYTTLLSLVPLLAISFSVLKGFGVHNKLEPMLQSLLEPLGEKGVEITARIIEFVENVKVGVLGAVGLGLLIFTVISLLQKIERAFNFTWHVDQHRPIMQRFSDYLSVLLVGPLLIFSSIGLSASVTSSELFLQLAAIEPLGTFIKIVSRLVPYLMIVAAFTFMYKFMPNTRVRLGSALIGGLVSGLVWDLTGRAFAIYAVSSSGYSAIYSAFATLIMFMIWLYLGWLILLSGSSIAFYHQHPEYLGLSRRELKLSNRVKEKLALMVVYLIGREHYRAGKGWSLDAIAQRVAMPNDAVASVVNALEGRRILARSDSLPPRYLPGRPFESVEIAEILDAVRAADERSNAAYHRIPPEPGVERIMGGVERAMDAALAGRTARDLALGEREMPLPGQTPADAEKPGASRGTG